MARATAPGGGVTEHLAQESYSAYYVDLTFDEEDGVVIDAQIDSLLRDLELWFQEQLATLAEDGAEQNAIRKEKAVITDHEHAEPRQQQDHSTIMVLEESVASSPTRPVELITPQSGSRSRWFV